MLTRATLCYCVVRCLCCSAARLTERLELLTERKTSRDGELADCEARLDGLDAQRHDDKQ